MKSNLNNSLFYSAAGVTPLYYAVNVGCEEVVEALIAGGANVHVTYDSIICDYQKSVTMLHLAAKKGYAAIVVKLLEAGVNVNSFAQDGGTPLHLAVEKGYKNVVAILLKWGADITARYNEKRCLLVFCDYGNGNPWHFPEEIYRKLKQEGKIGANAGQVCREIYEAGRTPAHVSVQFDRSDILKTLISAGAIVDNVDLKGNTPFSTAYESGNVGIMSILLRTKISGSATSLALYLYNKAVRCCRNHKEKKID